MVSVIIAVYEQANVLKLVLESLLRQTITEFEIVLADDGSSSTIAEVVQEYSSRFSIPIKHLWHEDDGFRKTIIVNKAAMAATGDYLVFIDGDCILHHQFLERHQLRAKAKHLQTGRRIMLSAEASKKVTPALVAGGTIEKRSFWRNALDEREANPKYGTMRPFFYSFFNLTHPDYLLLGCNFSLYKKDFVSVNGYDQQIIGRGLEDDNLGKRLKLAGIRIDYISQEAIQYHIHHSFKPIPHSQEIIDIMRNPKSLWAENGIV